MAFSGDAWLWIGAVVLLLVLGLLAVGVVLTTIKNIETYNSQQLYPFVGILGPGNTLSNHDGTNQIRCPVGKKIRILGAFFDVYDPYNECAIASNQGASTIFQTACSDITQNDNVQFSCSTAPNCSCSASGCVVSNGGAPASCECAHTDPSFGYQNCACRNYPGQNQFDCKGRDASAYLGKVCDGQNSCSVSLDTTGTDQQLTSVLGPYPCNISPVSSSDAPNYELLPMVRGNQGLSGTALSPMKQGYTVHGLFSCE
jgi:hypothetical protein